MARAKPLRGVFHLLLLLLLCIGRASAFLRAPSPLPARHLQRLSLATSSTPSPAGTPTFIVTRTLAPLPSSPDDDDSDEERATATLTVTLADGRAFTLRDACPPTGHSLLHAKVDPAVLALQDPAFGTRFDLRTGRVRGAWCPDAPRWMRWLRLLPPPQGLTVLSQGGGDNDSEEAGM